MQYYSDEARDKIESRRALWSPELQERVSKQWMDLFARIERNVDKDPAGPEAQELAARWTALIEEFTGGDAEITRGLANLYRNRAECPTEFQQQMKPFGNTEVYEYMDRVIAARRS